MCKRVYCISVRIWPDQFRHDVLVAYTEIQCRRTVANLWFVMTDRTGESKEDRNMRRERSRREVDSWEGQPARRFTCNLINPDDTYWHLKLFCWSVIDKKDPQHLVFGENANDASADTHSSCICVKYLVISENSSRYYDIHSCHVLYTGSDRISSAQNQRKNVRDRVDFSSVCTAQSSSPTYSILHPGQLTLPAEPETVLGLHTPSDKRWYKFLRVLSWQWHDRKYLQSVCSFQADRCLNVMYIHGYCLVGPLFVVTFSSSIIPSLLLLQA